MTSFCQVTHMQHIHSGSASEKVNNWRSALSALIFLTDQFPVGDFYIQIKRFFP